MTITLPDELRDEIERKARAGGFASVAEYLAYLVATDDEAEEDMTGVPVPEELIVKDRADLEAKLRASLNSGPPIPADEAFWEERRRNAEEAIARRNGDAP